MINNKTLTPQSLIQQNLSQIQEASQLTGYYTDSFIQMLNSRALPRPEGYIEPADSQRTWTFKQSNYKA